MARPQAWRRSVWLGVIGTIAALAAVVAVAQGRFHRRHTATEARPLVLLPADQEPPAESRAEIDSDADHGHRHIESNSVPQHLVGRFPNRGNPNSIREQRFSFRLPLEPEIADKVTWLSPGPNRERPRGRPPGPPPGPPLRQFGVALNGVPFEPGAAEFYLGNRRLGWSYEPLGGAVRLGLDANHAHVQPTGKYHYHGLPTGLMERLGHSPDKHSPQIGWAADGFPIYAQYGYADPQDPASEIVELHSGYRLREGDRPGGDDAPDGPHDGTFVQDYEFVEGAGELDECNGRECVTPDFPDGTYAYFMTTDWPVVPRGFRGTPARMQ